MSAFDYCDVPTVFILFYCIIYFEFWCSIMSITTVGVYYVIIIGMQLILSKTQIFIRRISKPYNIYV